MSALRLAPARADAAIDVLVLEFCWISRRTTSSEVTPRARHSPTRSRAEAYHHRTPSGCEQPGKRARGQPRRRSRSPLPASLGDQAWSWTSDDFPNLERLRSLKATPWRYRTLADHLARPHFDANLQRKSFSIMTSATDCGTSAVQFLINSTLKAEKEVQQQRAANELLSKELARLTALFQERRGTVLEAKEEALSAVAQLCSLQLREKRLREEEEGESSNATREAALLKMAVADHRKVQVLSQVLERSLDEKHRLQCNAFKNADEITVLQELRATLKASTGSKCPRTSLENIAGLQDYDAQTRSENATLRQQVKEREATLHKMRLQLRNVLDMSKEATMTFESNAKKLDEDIKLRKEQEHKANKDLQQLEREVSILRSNIANLEHEQRRLRQELRDL